jgi:hypothetical protein
MSNQVNDINERRNLINRNEKDQFSKSNKFKTRIIDSEISSSLVLAILIYYNTYYSIIIIIFEYISIFYKLWVFQGNSFTIIRTIVVLLWGFVEIIRLYIGYKSNINESFPGMINFILVSIVFCIAPQILFIVGSHVLPIDIACVIIYFLFMTVELFVTLYAIKIVINSKTANYILRNTATSFRRPDFSKSKTSKEVAHEAEEMLKNEKEIKKVYDFYRNNEYKDE